MHHLTLADIEWGFLCGILAWCFRPPRNIRSSIHQSGSVRRYVHGWLVSTPTQPTNQPTKGAAMSGVPAQPMPTQWGFDAAPGLVVLQFSNPFCDGCHFMQADEQFITQFCEQIKAAAKKARELAAANGLAVVEQPLLGPDGKPVAVPVSPEVAEHVQHLQSVGEGTVGEAPQQSADSLAVEQDERQDAEREEGD